MLYVDFQMIKSIYIFIAILFLYAQDTYPSKSNSSRFQLDKEARDALCPFVGTEGMRCFDGSPTKSSSRFLDFDFLKLPRGVGISVDRSTGQLKAPAIKLTYVPEGSRTWTDGFTGNMFDTFNEAIVAPATRVVAAYDRDNVQIFVNASQLNAAWQETFANGQVRGGELARSPDMFG